MAEACRRLDTPVTGGNVSFYNQSPDGAVYPTPTIGMVGVLERVEDKMTLDFKTAGDIIFMLGVSRNDIGSSEYLHKVQGVEFSPAPYFDLEEEVRLHGVLAGLIKKKLVRSAHDVSEGGLFVTLAESAFSRGLGFKVEARDPGIRKDAYWFGESQGRVVVSVSASQLAAFGAALGDFPVEELGVVTDGLVRVDGMDWGSVGEWKALYENSLESCMAAMTDMDQL